MFKKKCFLFLTFFVENGLLKNVLLENVSEKVDNQLNFSENNEVG